MSETIRVQVDDGGIDLRRGEVAPAMPPLPAALLPGWRRALARARAGRRDRVPSIAVTLERSPAGDAAWLTIDAASDGATWSMTVPLARIAPHDIFTHVDRSVRHARLRATRATSSGHGPVALAPIAVAQWLAAARARGGDAPTLVAPGTRPGSGPGRADLVIDHFEQLSGSGETWSAIANGSAGRVAIELRWSIFARALADRRRRGGPRRAVVYDGTIFRTPAVGIGAQAWQST